MKKDNLLEIFEELLKEWEDSESIVIHDRGSLDDYTQLEKRIEGYRQRFFDALNGTEK
ncbi:hypothetical protein [Bacillus thuringiensis]|uniref:hypothetical protein n=1 Tax=Bacillus thuringiensis TaxID=1428 RepID=UPI0015967717|nr:hypothetical protein [Bacillus thuringiensis]